MISGVKGEVAFRLSASALLYAPSRSNHQTRSQIPRRNLRNRNELPETVEASAVTSPLALDFGLAVRIGSEETSICHEVNCKTEEGSDIPIGGCDVILNDCSPSVPEVVRRNLEQWFL